MSTDLTPFQTLKRKSVKHHLWDSYSNSSLTTKIFPLLRLSQLGTGERPKYFPPELSQ